MDHVRHRRKSAAIFLPLLAGLWLLAEKPAKSQEETPEPAAINFERDIEPILKSRCLKCHGPEKRESGLRLDGREFAAEGGDSQLPILKGTLETNEILQRITATELADRMPFGEEPLAEREIQLFREWVKAGTPWPDSAIERPTTPATERSPLEESPWDQYGTPFHKWFYTSPIALELSIALLVFQVLILLNERFKRRPANAEKQRARLEIFRRMGPKHYAFGFLLFGGVFSLSWYYGKTGQLAEALERSKSSVRRQGEEINRLKEIAGERTPSVDVVYGNPPVPIRPRHPAGLLQVYYRGNDERSDKLFNGGFYRTSTMEVALSDVRGNLLAVGDAVLEDGLAIRFQFERSRGTVERLFGPDLIDNVCLSVAYPREKADSDPSSRVKLEVIEAGQHWGAIYPLPGSAENSASRVKGLIYVYHQSRVEFGICYDLWIHEGRIEDGSEVWMGNLTVMDNLALPKKDKIEQSEWFDFRPIPEIEGENSQDPKLLGIPEHVPNTKESRNQ